MPNPIMDHFAWSHLPTRLAMVSAPLGKLAKEMDDKFPDSAEKSAGLRKLLEAKDCFVRCAKAAHDAAQTTPGQVIAGQPETPPPTKPKR